MEGFGFLASGDFLCLRSLPLRSSDSELRVIEECGQRQFLQTPDADGKRLGRIALRAHVAL